MPRSVTGRRRRQLAIVCALCILTSVVLVVMRVFTTAPAPQVHVRWKPGVNDEQRRALEAHFLLVTPEQTDATTFSYDLLNTSGRNLRALVHHPDVDDTHGIDRRAFAINSDSAGDATRWVGMNYPVLRTDTGLMLVLLVLGGVAGVTGWVTTRPPVS